MPKEQPDMEKTNRSPTLKKCCNCKSPLKVKLKKKQQQLKKKERETKKVASFPIYSHLVLGKGKDLNHYFYLYIP